MSKLAKLLKTAVKVTTELEQLSHQKLSAEAFLEEAFQVAKTSDEKLDALEDQLLARPELEGFESYFRRAEKWIKEPTCPRMPQEISRIRWLFSENTESELGILGIDAFIGFALAVRSVTQMKEKNYFGEINDWDDHVEKITQLKNQKQRLFYSIEEAYAPSDLDFDSPDSNGRVSATFKLSNCEVPIGPNAGERLVSWAMNNPEVLGGKVAA